MNNRPNNRHKDVLKYYKAGSKLIFWKFNKNARFLSKFQSIFSTAERSILKSTARLKDGRYI
jgi:hypothetical protein